MSTTNDQIVSSISASEKPINKILCSDYHFSIPNYQRPYSWDTDRALLLLTDILEFALKPNDLNTLPPYFTGSIVIIKRPTSVEAKVVDGQQRLTTFTILLSCLRHVIEDTKLKGEITDYIYEPGSRTKGTKDSFRLELRLRDQEYFNKVIQKENGLVDLDLASIVPDSQMRIRENANVLLDQLRKYNQTDLEKLTMFITQRCFLVLVATSDEDSAFRIFNVLNDRGMQLSHADILKSEILEKIPNEEQKAYTDKWEESEAFLGVENFKELFSHIRFIYAKKKASESILKEIRTYANPSKDPKGFIDNRIEPLAEQYGYILHHNYKSSSHADSINRTLKWLKHFKHTDWVPPAMEFMRKSASNPAAIDRFLKTLERLTLGIEILGLNLNKRLEKFAEVQKAIEDNNSIFSNTSPLFFSKDEQRNIIEILNRPDVYFFNRFIKYLLLKIDEFISSGHATYDYDIVQVEHVLPRTPNNSSDWLKLFTEEERSQMTNCLGNLLLLDRRKNPKAYNYDFDTKKDKYFKDGGTSPFALTTVVLMYPQWTPDIINSRKQEMVNSALAILNISTDTQIL